LHKPRSAALEIIHIPDYVPPAPQTTPYLDYLQSSAKALFHTLDQQRGILCHMNSRAVTTLISFLTLLLIVSFY